MDPATVLEVLVIGALMGMLGQGARAVVGLKSMADDAHAQGLSPNDLFQAARLITSLLIGTLVGLASALVYFIDGGTAAQLTWHYYVAWAAAAYAGTDALEGFISQYLSPATPTPKTATLALTTDDVATLLAAKLPSSPPLSPTPTCSSDTAWKITVAAFAARKFTVSEKNPDQLLSEMNLTDFNSLRELLRQLNDRIDEQHGLSDAFAISWQQKGITVGTVQNAVEYAPSVPVTPTS